jgi:hypothetical protein
VYLRPRPDVKANGTTCTGCGSSLESGKSVDSSLARSLSCAASGSGVWTGAGHWHCVGLHIQSSDHPANKMVRSVAPG